MRIVKSLVLGLLLMASVSVFAQDLNPKQKEKVTAEVEQMSQVMELSKSEKAKVLEIKMEQAVEGNKIQKTTEKGSAERKEAYQALGKKYNLKLKEAVSKEQWKKWLSRPKN
ncbi:hypothetical protein [Mangrovibacterium sp.]|uniref:hypothetical protein n=1 Tax=Mangrovibacterium sp. TaxID=1961364 RepID=UPI003569E904